ncbi:hypothetical protein PARPLA_01815 [Rhodobacteraceae bacterium THAF1]|uniref:hypothetical protein n=1 Tax=Palleronia sp. THAF1 TaxID=2587842 RepID=UPI000F4027F8|nr:hypothetical protein [Palleronia sp. THAF1]QFU09050.1 hypothetical protein FIU81_10225 [Palleronia sp. THAF1]VDC24159.1 hypothetical protein PARPLA_01815 [Rhodobacteraceae bacterium THAF1]
MSEPLSSGDVERVLANIRKLVSTQPTERKATRERLMLTSDLRVPQEEAAVTPEKGSAAPEPVERPAPTVDGPAIDQSLESRIAQLESAVAAEQGFEPDGSEAQEPPLPGAMPDLAARFAEDEGEEGEASDADMAPTAPTNMVPADATMSQELDADLPVEAQTALPATQDDNVSVSDNWAFDILPSADESAAQPAGLTDAQSEAEVSLAEKHVFHGDPVDDLNAPEAPFTEAEEQEPAAGLHFIHSEPSRSTIEATDDEDTVIDEELLREMISEIVREELAGALGERITRNVKKLVRREIMRALSAREFD